MKRIITIAVLVTAFGIIPTISFAEGEKCGSWISKQCPKGTKCVTEVGDQPLWLDDVGTCKKENITKKPKMICTRDIPPKCFLRDANNIITKNTPLIRHECDTPGGDGGCTLPDGKPGLCVKERGVGNKVCMNMMYVRAPQARPPTVMPQPTLAGIQPCLPNTTRPTNGNPTRCLYPKECRGIRNEAQCLRDFLNTHNC